MKPLKIAVNHFFFNRSFCSQDFFYFANSFTAQFLFFDVRMTQENWKGEIGNDKQLGIANCNIDTLQTLIHQPSYCCRELTSAHSWQLASNQKPLISYRMSLSTKLSYPLKFALSTLAMIADVVRSMLKTLVTLGDISLVLLNLIKRFIFVVFKLLPPMFTQLTFIFSLQFTNYNCFSP